MSLAYPFHYYSNAFPLPSSNSTSSISAGNIQYPLSTGGKRPNNSTCYLNQSTVIADTIHEGKYETKQERDNVRLAISEVARKEHDMMREREGKGGARLS